MSKLFAFAVSKPARALAVVILLLCIRLVLLVSLEPSHAGDGAWYLAYAEAIYETYQLPPLTHKILGFPVYLAVIKGMFDVDLLIFQARLQATLDLIIVGGLVLLVMFSGGIDKRLKYALACLILLQPFTATLAHTLLVEPLLSFLLFSACIIFGLGVIASTSIMSLVWLTLSAVLMGLATLMRVEMAPIVMITLAVVIYRFLLKGHFRKPVGTLAATLMILAVLTPGASYVSAQYISTGEIGIARNNYGWNGYYAWLRTWVMLEKQHYRPYAFSIGSDQWRGYESESYPDLAFDVPEERLQIEHLTRQMAQYGYTDEVDTAFQDTADKRVRRHPFRIFVFLPLFRGMHYFINLEGSEFYLRTPAIPRPVRVVAILLVHLCKAALLILAAYGAWIAVFRLQKLQAPIRPLALFAATVVITRWCFLMAMSPFMVAGLMEARYVYILWPLILLLAIVPLWRDRENDKQTLPVT